MISWTLLIVIGAGALVFGLVILGMSLGVILSNRRIQGSCGGLGTMRDDQGKSICMACGSSPDHCEEEERPAANSR